MVARWARNVRQEIRRNISRHVRATSRQWPDSGSSNAAERPSRRLARTARLAPDLAAQCPRRKLARQLATWPRNSRATAKATSRKQLVGISPSAFNHNIQKIMNTPTTPTPDLESLRKAVQAFRPNSHRVPFNNLKPFHDSIAELRGKKASYFIIAEILQQNGVKTSRARVAEYGRIVLDGGKSRKRRKRAKFAPAVAVKPAPATPAPTAAPAGNVTPPPKENSSYHSRGPHIANVKMMTLSEREEFEASLKSKPPAS